MDRTLRKKGVLSCVVPCFVFTERERVLQALASHDVLRTALLLPGGLGRRCCCRAADSRLQIAFCPLLEDEERPNDPGVIASGVGSAVPGAEPICN